MGTLGLREGPIKDCVVCGKMFHPKRQDSLVCMACNSSRALRRHALDQYGKVCGCCGEAQYEFLAIDHSFNDGAQWRKVHGNGKAFYLWLLRNDYPKDMGLRVLCHNCNSARGLYGYCPHESPLLAR